MVTTVAERVAKSRITAKINAENPTATQEWKDLMIQGKLLEWLEKRAAKTATPASDATRAKKHREKKKEEKASIMRIVNHQKTKLTKWLIRPERQPSDSLWADE